MGDITYRLRLVLYEEVEGDESEGFRPVHFDVLAEGSLSEMNKLTERLKAAAKTRERKTQGDGPTPAPDQPGAYKAEDERNLG